MEFLEQVISIIVLLFGLVLGDFIATRAFGKPKSSMFSLVEIVLYAIVITLLGGSIFLYQNDLNTMLAVNFAVGFLTVLIVRAISTAIGAASEAPGKIALGKYTREEKLLIETAKAMAANGIEIEEIKKVAERAEFSRGVIRNVFSQHHFEVKPHPLMHEIAKLEEIIAELKKKTKS